MTWCCSADAAKAESPPAESPPPATTSTSAPLSPSQQRQQYHHLQSVMKIFRSKCKCGADTLVRGRRTDKVNGLAHTRTYVPQDLRSSRNPLHTRTHLQEWN